MSQLNKTETDVEPSSYDSGKTAAPNTVDHLGIINCISSVPMGSMCFFFSLFFFLVACTVLT